MMKPRRIIPDTGKQAELLANIRREQEERDNSYRGQALKLFPPICGHCGREFEGKRLKELTVHHKDHNHDNNPPDGSNWELLCLYCHEYEHTNHEATGTAGHSDSSMQNSTFKAFEGLAAILQKPKKET
jgi:hypothetical protein